MDSSTIAIIAVVALVVLAGLFLAVTSVRRDRAAATGILSRESRRRDRGNPLLEAEERTSAREVERAAVLERQGGRAVVKAPTPAPPAPRAPLDEEAIGVTRRQFFNRGIVTMFGLGLSGFGAATIGFLWPTLSGGFGSKIRVGKIGDVISNIRANNNFYYVAEGRMYLVEYPKDALAAAEKVYSGAVLDGMKGGLVALYQKCVHLGCRVPQCESSQWFECPCHGSQYNRVGEKKGGPAPRGLDRFGIDLSGGVVSVDTSQIIQGPPVGTDTTGQQAEGPHCA